MIDFRSSHATIERLESLWKCNKSYEEEKQEEPAPTENQMPKTGDIKDGMMYVEGFGWVPYEGGGGEGIYADDMYENGNKIGIMD